jgi:hypothetical protein
VPILRLAKFLANKVVLYFDALDDDETCVKFTFERYQPVANVTHCLSVLVYEERQ